MGELPTLYTQPNCLHRRFERTRSFKVQLGRRNAIFQISTTKPAVWLAPHKRAARTPRVEKRSSEKNNGRGLEKRIRGSTNEGRYSETPALGGSAGIASTTPPLRLASAAAGSAGNRAQQQASHREIPTTFASSGATDVCAQETRRSTTVNPAYSYNSAWGSSGKRSE